MTSTSATGPGPRTTGRRAGWCLTLLSVLDPSSHVPSIALQVLAAIALAGKFSSGQPVCLPRISSGPLRTCARPTHLAPAACGPP